MVDTQPTPRVVYVIGGIAALAGLLFGLDIGVISGALPLIANDFQVSTVTQELIVSILLWGAMLGAILGGLMARRLGRKITLLIAAVIFTLGSLGSGLAPSAEALIAMRAGLGLAVGMASFTAPLYLSEVAPPHIRGAMISMYQLLITIGIVGAFLSDTYFAGYAVINGIVGDHWRMMLGVISIPSALLFVMLLFLPRSPRWLMLREDHDRARAVLQRTRATLEQVELELAAILEDLSIDQKGFRQFRTNANFRRAVYLGVGLQIIQQLTGINVIMYYAPKIFEAAGFASTAEQMWATVLVGCTNVVTTFIAIALVDRIGRKPLMYAGFVVMGLSMGTVSAAFAIGVHAHPAATWLAVAGLECFIIGFAASAGPVIWVLCSEIYPTSGRDFGVTVSTATNWIANGVVGMTFLSLLVWLGPAGTFLLYALLEAAFIVLFLLVVPETRGVSLEAIAADLLAGVKLRKLGASARQQQKEAA